MDQPQAREKVTQLFVQAVTAKGFSYSEVDTGFYRVDATHGPIEIRLENIIRDYQRDADETRVVGFFEQVLEPVPTLASLDAASAGLYLSLEPTHVLNDNVVHQRLGDDDVVAVLAHFIPGQGRITFISHDMLAAWQCEIDQAWSLAQENLNQIFAAAQCDVRMAGDVAMGFLQVAEPYKASCILATNLKDKTEQSLGWPLYAITPDRDFVYLVADNIQPIIRNILQVANDQYAAAEYPIAAQLWRLDDEGVRTVEVYESDS